MDQGRVYPHRIRLRGPWQWQPLERCSPGAEPLPAARTLAMPSRWRDAGISFAGRARLRRAFGYPGRIDETERVWLIGEGVAGQAALTLNGRLLGQVKDDSFAFDVTALLTTRNRLEIAIASADGAGGLTGDVALEIRRSAYLHDVRLEASLLRGAVVGISDRPLELYVLVAGRTVAYHTLQPTAAGQAFAVPLELPATAAPSIRVELVDASVVWYVVELPGR